MANVKNRDNTSKRAANGKGSGKVGRPKKSVSDMNNTKNTPIQVMKTPRTDKTSEKLQSSKKDRGLLCKLIDKILLNNAKLRKYIQLPNSNIKTIANGPIVNKNKHNLKLYDNILKSELMIDDNKTQEERNIEAQTEKIIQTYKDKKLGTNTLKKDGTYTEKNIETNTEKNIGTHTEKKIGTNIVKKIGTYKERKIRTNTERKITDNKIKKNPKSKIGTNAEKRIHTNTDKKLDKKIESITEKKTKRNASRKIETNREKKIALHFNRRSEGKSETSIVSKIADKLKSLNNNDQALTNQNTHNEILLTDNNVLPGDSLDGSKGSDLNKSNHCKNKEENLNTHSGLKKRIRPKRIKKPIDKSCIFQCDLCQKQFHSKCSLRRHMYIHLQYKNNYKCKQCNKGFRKQLYLSAHIRRQHPNWEKHYMCNMCDMPFQLKENLTVHLASHTRSETMFKCVYCKEKFVAQQELIKHEKEHLVSGRYQCIICEMDFDCRNRLTTHFKTHYKVKDYICQHCGKEFIRMNTMRRHVSIYHSGIKIQCPICNKFLKGHLTEHMRTHEKKRPHECPECGQRFIQSTQLNVHRRSHSGARPYPCRICNRPFSHSNALMLHIRRHTGEKPFVCAMCPISFSQLPHMKAHMRNIHGKVNPYRCQKCDQFFKLKVELESHVKICTVNDKVLSIEEKNQASVLIKGQEQESPMSLSRMRFLLALLLTKIATKEKLKYLGFNKRLIDDILIESLEGMVHKPCKDESLAPITRLRKNIEILLDGTVPKDQMEKFKNDKKSTEELLELLTNENKYN